MKSFLIYNRKVTHILTGFYISSILYNVALSEHIDGLFIVVIRCRINNWVIIVVVRFESPFIALDLSLSADTVTRC